LALAGLDKETFRTYLIDAAGNKFKRLTEFKQERRHEQRKQAKTKEKKKEGLGVSVTETTLRSDRRPGRDQGVV